MTPADKMEAVRVMYEKGDLTAADLGAVLAEGVAERAVRESADALTAQAAKAQKFFADLARAARSPGYGDQHRSFVANLLLRATEAGLYAPENP